MNKNVNATLLFCFRVRVIKDREIKDFERATCVQTFLCTQLISVKNFFFLKFVKISALLLCQDNPSTCTA